MDNNPNLGEQSWGVARGDIVWSEVRNPFVIEKSPASVPMRFLLAFLNFGIGRYRIWKLVPAFRGGRR